jgi:hypothetical protein
MLSVFSKLVCHIASAKSEESESEESEENKKFYSTNDNIFTFFTFFTFTFFAFKNLYLEFQKLLEYLIKYIKFSNSLVDKIHKCSAGKIRYGALATIRCRTQVMGVLRVSGEM